MMHFHQWGNWEDVKVGEKVESALGISIIVVRQVITQQRRCSVCNLVKTRLS